MHKKTGRTLVTVLQFLAGSDFHIGLGSNSGYRKMRTKGLTLLSVKSMEEFPLAVTGLGLISYLKMHYDSLAFTTQCVFTVPMVVLAKGS